MSTYTFLTVVFVGGHFASCFGGKTFSKYKIEFIFNAGRE